MQVLGGGKLNVPLGSLHDVALCQKLQKGSMCTLLRLNVLRGPMGTTGSPGIEIEALPASANGITSVSPPPLARER